MMIKYINKQTVGSLGGLILVHPKLSFLSPHFTFPKADIIAIVLGHGMKQTLFQVRILTNVTSFPLNMLFTSRQLKLFLQHSD